MKRYIRSSDAMNPGWSKRYDRELQETYYVLAIPGKTATVVEFDDDGDFGCEARISGKATEAARKTFHGQGSTDKAMTWAEKQIYKQPVKSSIDTVKSWLDYLSEDVRNRLGECSTKKADLKPLVDAKWRRMKELGKEKQGFTREDALVSVLELLDSNSCDNVADLTREEYDELKFDPEARPYSPKRRAFWPNGKKLTDDELIEVLMYFYGEDAEAAREDAKSLDEATLQKAIQYYIDKLDSPY